VKDNRIYLNWFEILEYFIHYSELLKYRGKTYWVLNSNQFGKKFHKNSTLIKRWRFLKFQEDLLNNLLIYQIKSNDERSKYYSITPLGIMWYVKKLNTDKIGMRERKQMIKILESYANKPVRSYKSKIFGDLEFIDLIQKMDSPSPIDNEIWLDDVRDTIPVIWSNFESDTSDLVIKYPLDYPHGVDLFFARFRFQGDSFCHVQELKSRFSAMMKINIDYNIKLNEDQFYNYLAKLMIFMLIPFTYLLKYDINDLQDISFDDDILKILLRFNVLVKEVLESVFKNNLEYDQILNSLQFKIQK